MKFKKDNYYLLDRIWILFIINFVANSIVFIYLLFNIETISNYIFLAVWFIFIIVIVYISYKWVYEPHKKIAKVLRLFYKGDIFKGVFSLRVHISHETYKTFAKFREIIDTKELIEGSKKHAEYLALQNQINPHFLYNTLEAIRSEALIEEVDSIADMTESLATFFRYTISNISKLVTLSDELENVKNYYKIQKFRFDDKINLNITYDIDDIGQVLGAKIPKLTLQPICENAIFHGLETKIGKGEITLKIRATEKRLIIVISDNGVGIDEKKVDKINKKLRGASLEYMKKDSNNQGGIALINVNNRIKLIFGDEYGIYMYSRLGAGTDVEITVPFVLD